MRASLIELGLGEPPCRLMVGTHERTVQVGIRKDGAIKVGTR